MGVTRDYSATPEGCVSAGSTVEPVRLLIEVSTEMNAAEPATAAMFDQLTEIMFV